MKWEKQKAKQNKKPTHNEGIFGHSRLLPRTDGPDIKCEPALLSSLDEYKGCRGR